MDLNTCPQAGYSEQALPAGSETSVNSGLAVNPVYPEPSPISLNSAPSASPGSLPDSKKVKLRDVEKLDSTISRKHDIEKQALECRTGFRTIVDSEELVAYLLKNKIKSIQWIKRHVVSEELLAKTLTPELLISSKTSFCWVCSLPFTREQYLAFARQGIAIFDCLPEDRITDDLFLACLALNPKEIVNLKKTKLLFTDPRIQKLKDNCSASHITQILPETQWTPSLILKLAEEWPHLIGGIPASRSDYSDLVEILIKKDATLLQYIPVKQRTEKLVDLAVNGSPACDLKDIPPQLLTKDRCLSAIHSGNKGTLCSPPDPSAWYWKRAFKRLCLRHPEVAEAGVDCLFWAFIVPNSLKTKELVGKHLSHFPKMIEKIPQELLKKNRHWCENAVKCRYTSLEHVPEEVKDYELCLLAVKSSGKALQHVPQSLLIKHPDLLDIAIENYVPLFNVPEGMRTAEICARVMSLTPFDTFLKYVPENLKPQLPPWVLAAGSPEDLPEKWQKHVLKTQDTCYLPDLPSSKPAITRDALLKPMPPNASERSPLFFQLKKQLLACKPFELSNKQTGLQLQKHIATRHTWFTEKLAAGSLPVLDSLPERAEVYGGRAVLADNGAGSDCQRYKFLRKGEPLSEFFQEEAVHWFYHNAEAGSQLRSALVSEVPRPGNISLIAPENMPERLLNSFRSELETVVVEGKPFYVCYQFTTKNRDYSTLAHQKEKDGSTVAAEQGLLKAAQDLGVWSSCGAVHTSTIKAFHNLRDNRKQLFLTPLLTNQYNFPGAMDNWKSKATDESDWGWSGLRDIGDMEFYPHIEAYTSAVSATYQLPGYAQRCSFLEGFASNMIAAVIHYARLHGQQLPLQKRESGG